MFTSYEKSHAPAYNTLRKLDSLMYVSINIDINALTFFRIVHKTIIDK